MNRFIRLGSVVLVLLLMGWWAQPLLAQDSTGSIRGKVTDSASTRAIQGVTVSYGDRKAVSRADGTYLITGLPSGSDSLRFRSIGYAPHMEMVTVTAGQPTTVDASLVLRAVNLAEVVSIGYGQARAGDITGAVTQVNSDEFNGGRVVTPSMLIQNKVAGVQVVENNEPGATTTIRIRGATSVNASSEPLIVVDGLPLGASGAGIAGGRDPLNFVNPNDIESMTVLRDASAAAIYGANAANGVVLITTKSGRGKPKFEYTGSTSASLVTRLPSMLNTAEFRTAVETYGDSADKANLGNASTNWFKQIDRTAYGQEQNFGISGSSPSLNYRLSSNFLTQDGIIDASSTKRVTLGTNFDQRLLNDRLDLKLNFRGSRADDHFTPGGVLSGAAQMGPTQPITDDTARTGFYNWPQYPAPDNPLEILANAVDQSTTYRGVGNLVGSYNFAFLDGLSANVNLGFDATKADRQTFNASVLHAQVHSDHGTLNRQNQTQVNTVAEAFLDYKPTMPVGPGNLDLVAGYSFSKGRGEFYNFLAKGLSTDQFGINGIPVSDFQINTLFKNNSRLISFFGRINYNISDRYLAEFSLRRDGSSRFGADKDYGWFPAASVGWRISQESFLKDKRWLSDLKLRASWARTGNQSFADYLPYSVYTQGDAQVQYQLGDSLFTTDRPSAVDPSIHWETTRSIDVGLDYGFKGQRFTGAIDFYDKKTSDLIFTVPVPAFSNLSNFVTTNIGTMRNRGIELSLSAAILQGQPKGGISWQADFTAAHNKNELLTITPFGGGGLKILTGNVSGGVGTTIQVLTPGQPVNAFFVFQHIMENGKPIYKDVNGSTIDGHPNGVIDQQDLYVDQNGDGKIDQNDLRPFHDPAPKWILGHTSYFAYKKFDFGFTLRAYIGNYVYNNVAANLGNYQQVANNGSPYNLNSSVLTTGFVQPQFQSDFYVENASFLRMDNISAGYSFDIRGERARVYVAGQNLFTITGYSGVDPTANTPGASVQPLNGIDNNIYPRSRTFTAGLTLQL